VPLARARAILREWCGQVHPLTQSLAGDLAVLALTALPTACGSSAS